MSFSTTPPPDDQLTLLVWFIVRFKPDATNNDPTLRRGTIFPVPGSYLGGYMSKPGWDWMRLDEFWQGAEVATGDSKASELAGNYSRLMKQYDVLLAKINAAREALK